MHVLMSANAAWNIWNFRRPLVRQLLAENHRITVLAPRDKSVTDLERIGCRFVPLEMSVKGLNPLEDFKLMQRFKRTLRAERPDIVLSYTIKNNIFGAMAARACDIPFIPNVTGLGTAFLSAKLLQLMVEALYRRAFGPLPVVFVQNADDRDLFIQRRLIRAEQAQLLPGSGIDLSHFSATDLPPVTAPPVFLMIARLLRDKGVVEFVAAARQVRSRFPSARFQLLGATGTENRSAIDAATVQSWVDEGVVEYLGTTPDVRPFIAEAQCVVLPSYREGAPRTLIEAAAMARPLIATDVPGCRSVVQEGITGFLCEARNADSLAATMQRFLALPHATKVEMGRAGRTRMEHEFDEAIVVARYRQAIFSLIQSRKPALLATS